MKKLLTTLAILLIATVSYAMFPTDDISSWEFYGVSHYYVERVVDGDTLVIRGDYDGGSIKERVRLIGVDTPETVHPNKPVEYFGKEASAFTKRICEGKTVRIAYDQTRMDKYDRILAYVYLEDGTFVNAEIIKQGYGHAYTKFPFMYMEEFKEYEREAREQKLGLWAEESDLLLLDFNSKPEKIAIPMH